MDQKLWNFFIKTVLDYIKNIITNNFGRIKISIKLINNSVLIKIIVIRKKKLSR